MKAKIIEKEKEVKFEPITIELTIESEEQLCDLLNRLNPLGCDIDGINSGWLKFKAMDTEINNETLWDILYQKATILNLIK